MDSSNNKPQNSIPNNSDFNNRPRLRKIKRPKHHNGPIASQNASNSPSPVQNNPSFVPNVTPNFNSPTKPTALSSDDIIKMSQQGRDLIKANENEVYNQEFNNFATSNYDDPLADDDTFTYQGDMGSPNSFVASDNKKTLIIACICIVIGLVLGNFMFSNKKVVRDGLQGVVTNPEVPKGRSRCGIAEKTQGCVLYIMNPQRSELNGRDFYDLAAQLTGRQRFVIETGNMRYSTVKIKPGNIAQLNIPPLQ